MRRGNPSFTKRIITADEAWVQEYVIETIEQYQPKPKKPKFAEDHPSRGL